MTQKTKDAIGDILTVVVVLLVSAWIFCQLV